MSELLDLIQTEHKSILKYLSKLLHNDTIDYKIAVDFCEDIIQNNHHFKEEMFIFDSVVDKPELLAGGPYCVLYFDDHVLHAPFDQVKRLGKKLNIDARNDVSRHLISMYSKKTPLNIPIEDHESCRQLILISKNILSSKEHSAQDLKSIFETYVRIQSYHFEREERCFLKLVNSITTQTEKEIILQQFKDPKIPFINDSYIESYLYEKSKIKLL